MVSVSNVTDLPQCHSVMLFSEDDPSQDRVMAIDGELGP